MRKAKKAPAADDLSDLSLRLLAAMAGDPNRLEYNTRVLGGMFRNDDLTLLDDAYEQLREKGFVEPSGATVSFFGTPKSLFRISGKGQQYIADHLPVRRP